LLQGVTVEDFVRDKGGDNLREDESVSVEPVWVLRVEGHKLVEQDMGSWCAAHGGTGVTRVGFEGGIDLFNRVSLARMCSQEVY